MPADKVYTEARRIMVICNACRYCEGYCAVYPAMEVQDKFTDENLIYLANLCHNCRGCYYACQYAPPHEFSVNVPKTFADLRLASYRRFAWPGFLAGAFDRNGLTVTLLTVFCVCITVLLTVSLRGPDLVLTSQHGEGAFYAVIPYLTMVIPALLISVCAGAAMVIGLLRFWRAIKVKDETVGQRSVGLQSLAMATRDALKLTYLGGGGHGCYYPQDRASFARRWLHHLVFYGFICCFFASAVAAMYDHLLGLSPPYSFWSLAVLLGTGGGAALLVGSGGLLGLKWLSHQTPDHPPALSMDAGFLALLFLTSLTGLLLLALRETSSMGILLAIHLGLVLALFVSLPYGKFVHGMYRLAALVRYAIE